MYRYYDTFADYFIYGIPTIAMIFMLFGGLILFGLYIIKSIGLMQMAKDCGLANPWLAWIPIVDMYILGGILKRVDSNFVLRNMFNGSASFSMRLSLERPDLALLIIYLVFLGANWIPIFSSAVRFIAGILILLALYQLYQTLAPKNALIYTIVSAIFSPAIAVFIFILKNGFKNVNQTTPAEPPMLEEINSAPDDEKQ
ncbi:hypothetical protein [Vallitalea okinawensis]|uniref:hypothetical protein n=1 Tax=Vallitalea okinawensis TaxID=2078660 RepID=UPI000CFB0113|nr:hypothetical protein [Vallitalea okinawensis]